MLIKTEKSIAKHGRDSKTSKQNMAALAELFKFLKLTPRQFDPLIAVIRSAIEKIRTEERNIMRLCVRLSKMPRKEFIKVFPGNETNLKWTGSLIKAKAKYSERLKQEQYQSSEEISSSGKFKWTLNSQIKALIGE